jgi:integrator complex subunit 11
VGASESDLSILPKYRFQAVGNEETPDPRGGSMVPIENSSGANERVLSPEDAV